MNTKRQPKVPQMLRQLRHLIHADSNQGVRRRDLSDPAQGDVQLELDLVPRGKPPARSLS